MTTAATATHDAPPVEAQDTYVVHLDREMRVCGVSDDMLNRMGTTAAQVWRRPFADLLHPSVREVVLHQMGRLTGGSRRRVTTRFLGAEQRLGDRSGDATCLSGRMVGIAVTDTAAGSAESIVALVTPDRAPVRMSRPATSRKRLLSELDAKVLEGIAAGCSTVQMAGKLFLSRQGVEYHVGSMLRQFKCPNRSALVAKAFAQGVLTVGQWPPRVVPEHIR
jgi:DNA-binding CsgD family transcriptional regulator